jgi:vitamin B12 transporter
MIKRGLLLAGSLFTSLILNGHDALPERVTVAHRLETDLANLGSSITLFERDEIQLMGGLFLQDILRWTPGVSIARTGGPGQESKLYLRGTESRHTLVLLDGVELRNTNSADGFDIVHLQTGDIECIEVLRGPQSTLYGADALGGVINIVSRPTGGQPTSDIEVSVGSYDTLTGSFSSRGYKDRIGYALHSSIYESNGFSAAINGSERDPYNNHTTSLSLDYKLSNQVDLQFSSRLINTETHFDNSATDDVANFRSDQTDAFYQLRLDRKVDDENALDRIALTYKDFQRNNLAFGTEHFASQARKLEWQRSYIFADDLHFLGGIEYLAEKGQQERDYGFGPSTVIKDALSTTAVFGQLRKSLGNQLTLDLGTRVDDSSVHETEGTWRIAANYRLSESTRLKGSAGTGFYAPNVYYLAYAQNRQTLQPEQSIGYDIGIEHRFLGERATIGVTYFQNDIDNLFSWNSAFRVINVSEADTGGIEASIVWLPVEHWKLLFDWTHLKTKDLSTGKQLDFRPEDQVSIRLFWMPAGKKYQAFLGVRHRSVLYNAYSDSLTWETFNNSERNPSPSGANWEVSVRYQLSDGASFFLRGEDLFNQELEDMRDYNGNPYAVSGQIFRAGVTWTF